LKFALDNTLDTQKIKFAKKWDQYFAMDQQQFLFENESMEL
jgi:hypothetical protein